MTLLAIGLVLFIGIHLLPMATHLRARTVASLGLAPYRAAFSLVSALGLVLIILGKSSASFIHVWNGWPPAFKLAHAVMPVAFILLVAANMPTYIRHWTKHPMLIGVALWGAIHLAANGDLASILLFGSLLVWALVDMVSATRRGQTLEKTGVRPSLRFDALAVLAGAAAFWLVARFHDVLFGPAVM